MILIQISKWWRNRVFGSLAATILSAGTAAAQAGRDWPVWGGDNAGTKYSTLRQIHRGNVRELERAWVWEPNEKPIPGPRLPVPGRT